MKRTLPLLLVAAVMFAFTPHESNEVTVTGKLIDTKCYGMNHMNHENEHVVPKEDGSMGKMPNCGTACATMSIPVGILEGGKVDGKVYILVAPSSTLASHMAKTARVTGDKAFDGGIIPKKVEVKNKKGKWVEVELTTMM